VIPLRYDPAAEAELLDQVAYFESQRLGLGTRFLAEVKASETLISQFPYSSTEIDPGIRNLSISLFSFLLSGRRWRRSSGRSALQTKTRLLDTPHLKDDRENDDSRIPRVPF
jgi:hypothetical protein